MRLPKLVIFVLCFSFTISSKAYMSTEHIDKVKEYIVSKGLCELAVAIHDETDKVINPIYCIWSGVYAEGTINEGHSCMLGTVDVTNGKYGSFPGSIGVNAKETLGKTCTAEMVNDIVNKIPVSHFHPDMKNIPFKKAMLKEHPKTVLVYDHYGVWTSDTPTGASSPEKAPTSDPYAGWAKSNNEGFLYLKFGMTKQDVKKFKACKMDAKPFNDPYSSEASDGFTCVGMPYEDREIEGDIYFVGDKLKTIALQVGVPQAQGKKAIKDTYLHYWDLLTALLHMRLDFSDIFNFYCRTEGVFIIFKILHLINASVA